MDEQDRELLAGSLRSALAGDVTDIAALLDELGWDEVVADDPTTAIDLLFTEHGRGLAGTRALDTVVLPALGEKVAGRAVGYPVPGWAPDGESGIDALVLGPIDAVDEVVAPGAGGLVVAPAASLTTEPVRGLDRHSPWLRVRGSGGTVRELDPERWPDAVTTARKALAAEIIGVSTEALTIAREHTSSRKQYGRSIATFQAVRHRLAEGYVALGSARSVLDAAWVDGGSWTAMVAKAEAGRAQDQVSRHAMQVCGAIGLSEEHTLHRHVGRAAALDALLGGFRLLEQEIGDALLGGADFPRVMEV